MKDENIKDDASFEEDFVIESDEDDVDTFEDEASLEEEIELEEDGAAPSEDSDYTDEDFDSIAEDEPEKKRAKLNLAGKIGLGILAAIVIFAVWALFTNSGRRFCAGIAAKFIHSKVGTDTGMDEFDNINEIPDDENKGGSMQINPEGTPIPVDADGNEILPTTDPRSEDFVTNYLIFGIEQINGAMNTDAMMLVSIDTREKLIKLTSLMRDTYVTIPGWDKNKLNSAYAKGAHGSTGDDAREKGAALLIRTIEDTYDIKIDGYACVTFSRFEAIIDRLGGLDLELGKKEASYLNRTNYISKEYNRNLSEGWNHMNGNQVMGYVRVRKVVTLGGAENDYGRTLRQRRVINAIMKKCKTMGITELYNLASDCLPYIATSLSESQIQDALANVINDGITEIKSLRLPIDDKFEDSGKSGIFNGTKNVTYTLVMEKEGYLEANIEALHNFLFGDSSAMDAEGENGSNQ